MRYKELNEDQDQANKEMTAFIKNDCQQFLAESQHIPLYRGMKVSHGKEMIDGEALYHFDFRDDRKPSAADFRFFKAVDNGMKKAGFKATRSNSDLFSGSKDTAESYGEILVCFPLDGYHYSYSTKIDDYLNQIYRIKEMELEALFAFLSKKDSVGMSVEELRNDYGDDADVSKGAAVDGLLVDFPFEVGQWWWSYIGPTYKQDELTKGLTGSYSDNEMLVTGPNGYYAIDSYTYSQLGDL